MPAIETIVFGPPAYGSPDKSTLENSLLGRPKAEKYETIIVDTPPFQGYGVVSNEQPKSWLYELTKNELLALAKERGVEGLDRSFKNDDIISALQDANQAYEVSDNSDEETSHKA